MANPTTRGSTPPQSGRIAQQSPAGVTVLQGYEDTTLPSVAFTNQVAVNLSLKSLAYFDSNGVWQSVLGGADVQSFYGSIAPTSGVQTGDRWFNPTTLMWYSWNPTYGAWAPGDIAYSDSAPARPTLGQAWFHIHTRALTYWNGTAWVAGTDSTAPGVYAGAMPTAATAGSSWTDADGVVWGCDTGYTGGTGAGKWTRWSYRVDPLALLILANGAAIMAGEAASSPPTPAVPWSSVTVGLIWLDTQSGGNLGKLFVWDETAWRQVYAPNTVDLCLAILASQAVIEFDNLDTATATGPGAMSVTTSYKPIVGSVHVYWNGVFQPESEWSLTGRTLSLPDDSLLLLDGDIITVVYAYRVSQEPTRPTTIQLISNSHSHDLALTFILPDGTRYVVPGVNTPGAGPVVDFGSFVLDDMGVEFEDITAGQTWTYPNTAHIRRTAIGGTDGRGPYIGYEWNFDDAMGDGDFNDIIMDVKAY